MSEAEDFINAWDGAETDMTDNELPYKHLPTNLDSTRRYANRIRDAYTLTEAEDILTQFVQSICLSVIGEDVEIDYEPTCYADGQADVANNYLRAEQRLSLKEKIG